MNKKYIIILAMVLFLLVGSSLVIAPVWEGVNSSFLPTSNEYGNIRYGYGYDDYPINAIHREQEIGTRNAYEDGGWKRIENAKSLKNTSNYKIRYLRIDDDFGMYFKDFNTTSATICLNTTNLNQDIPFKMFNYNITGDKVLSEIELKEKNKEKLSKSKEPKIKFEDNKERCFVVNDVDILNKNFEFGFNSTEVSFNNPTVDEHLRALDDTVDDRNDFSETIFMGLLSGKTYRGDVEWDVSGIPNNVTILDTVFKYHGDVNSIDLHIHEMLGTRPSVSADQAVYDEIGEGTIYVDLSGFPEVGTNKEIDLGTDADSDLESQLDDDWFAIGFHSDDEATSAWSRIISEDGSPTPPPTLTVTYGTIIYDLTITSPTTANPNITSSGENITINFTFKKDEALLTSDISILNNITIGGELCNISLTGVVTPASCGGSPDNCDTYDADIVQCVNATCDWTPEFCGGTPTACDQFTDQQNCTFTNCTWSAGAPSTPEFETFESSLGNWDATGGDPGCDWLRDQDGTPSSSTGPQPQGSAPGANSTNYYVFVEASSGQCDNGEQAYLLGPTINFDDFPSSRLDFSYSMYGSAMGTLNVQINTSGSWSTIWTLAGNQGSSPVWSGAGVDLSAYSGNLAIRFEYDRTASGFQGDVAIDHLNISDAAGDVCSGNPLDCDAVNYTEQSLCENNTGCGWTIDDCDGTPASCGVYQVQGNCTDFGCDWSAESTNYFQQFSFNAPNWQVNCTVGAGCSGDNDLFLMANYTTDEIVRNDTQTNAVSCAATDTCTYGGSGDWIVDYADNCEITTFVDVGSNCVRITGDTGSFTIKSGGRITSACRAYSPDDFDGDTAVVIEPGGIWDVRP